MNPRLAIAMFGLILAPSLVGATTSEMTDSQKLDSLLVGQKKIIENVADEPLAGKNFGVEVNPFRLITLGATNNTSLSGSVSLFNVVRSAEIQIPIYYMDSPDEENDFYKDAFSLLTVDVHYRQFLGRTQNGFFLSGFGRLARLEGYQGKWLDGVFGDSTIEDKRTSLLKFGAGVGLGYRIFSHRGLYWGSSISLGRYFNGGENRFRGGFGSLYDDGKIIFDIELFKFGWAF